MPARRVRFLMEFTLGCAAVVLLAFLALLSFRPSYGDLFFLIAIGFFGVPVAVLSLVGLIIDRRRIVFGTVLVVTPGLFALSLYLVSLNSYGP